MQFAVHGAIAVTCCESAHKSTSFCVTADSRSHRLGQLTKKPSTFLGDRKSGSQQRQPWFYMQFFDCNFDDDGARNPEDFLYLWMLEFEFLSIASEKTATQLHRWLRPLYGFGANCYEKRRCWLQFEIDIGKRSFFFWKKGHIFCLLLFIANVKNDHEWIVAVKLWLVSARKIPT